LKRWWWRGVSKKSMMRRRGFGGKAPKQLAKLSKDVPWNRNCICGHGHYVFVMTSCYLNEFYGMRFGVLCTVLCSWENTCHSKELAWGHFGATKFLNTCRDIEHPVGPKGFMSRVIVPLEPGIPKISTSPRWSWSVLIFRIPHSEGILIILCKALAEIYFFHFFPWCPSAYDGGKWKKRGSGILKNKCLLEWPFFRWNKMPHHLWMTDSTS
jgi:hypothetical protein